MVKKRAKKKTAKKKAVRKRITKRNKKKVEDLIKSAPKKRRANTFLITLILGLLFLGTSFFGVNPTITGFAVQQQQPQPLIFETKLILDKQIPISGQFKVLDINKDSNSMLKVDFKSDLVVSTFVEIDDCGYWRDGEDKDNTVLLAIPDSKEANFNIGNLEVKTIQEIGLYKSSNLCLIFVNHELDNQGNINIKIEQTDKDKWTIIE